MNSKLRIGLLCVAVPALAFMACGEEQVESCYDTTTGKGIQCVVTDSLSRLARDVDADTQPDPYVCSNSPGATLPGNGDDTVSSTEQTLNARSGRGKGHRRDCESKAEKEEGSNGEGAKGDGKGPHGEKPCAKHGGKHCSKHCPNKQDGDKDEDDASKCPVHNGGGSGGGSKDDDDCTCGDGNGPPDAGTTPDAGTGETPAPAPAPSCSATPGADTDTDGIPDADDCDCKVPGEAPSPGAPGTGTPDAGANPIPEIP